MAERLVPDARVAVTAPQTPKEELEIPNSESSDRRTSRRRLGGLIFVVGSTALALGLLTSACGEQDETKTWTGILNVAEDCTLIPQPSPSVTETPTTPSATVTPVYWQPCPLKFSLTDKDGRIFNLEGEGEGFPNVRELTDDELKEFMQRVNGHLAEVRAIGELAPMREFSYKIRSGSSFNDFIEEVSGYVENNYPCLDPRSENRLPEDKPLGQRKSTYTWDEDGTYFILQLVDTSGDYNPTPSLEIISQEDGNFKAKTIPDNLKVCPD